MLETSSNAGILIFTFLFFANILCGIADPIPQNYTATKACNKFVEIEQFGLLNYLGNITFRSPTNFKGIWKLEMTTDKPFYFLGAWGVTVKVDAEHGRAEMYSKEIVDLRAGDRITFRFRVIYGDEHTIPYVKLLKWQGIQICTPPSERKSRRSLKVRRTSRITKSNHSNNTKEESNHMRNDVLVLRIQ